jgi:hypothetical protein
MDETENILKPETKTESRLMQVLGFVAAWAALTPKQQVALACRPVRPPLLPAVARPPRLLRTASAPAAPGRGPKRKVTGAAAKRSAEAWQLQPALKRSLSGQSGIKNVLPAGTVGSTAREATPGSWVRRLAGVAGSSAADAGDVIRLPSGVEVRLIRWSEAPVSKAEAKKQIKKAAARKKKAEQDETATQQRSISDLLPTATGRSSSEGIGGSSTPPAAAAASGEPVVWEQLFEVGGKQRPCCVCCLAPYPETTRVQYNSAFCSQECSAEFGVRASQSSARRAVYARDRGVCASCGRNAHALFAQLAALPAADPAARLALLEKDGYRPPKIGSRRRQKLLSMPEEGDLWQADHVVGVGLGRIVAFCCHSFTFFTNIFGISVSETTM